MAADRDDNDAVARNKGLNRALDTAVEKEAAATAPRRVPLVRRADWVSFISLRSLRTGVAGGDAASGGL